jgi:hypothetical protein
MVIVSRSVGVKILLSISLAACTFEKPASEAEKSAATRAVADCVVQNVARMDDRISDASIIAVSIIRGPCAREVQDRIEVIGRGDNQRTKDMIEDLAYSPQSGSVQGWIGIVLRERAKAKK